MTNVKEANPTIDIHFSNNVNKLHDDTIMLRAHVHDSLLMGNVVYSKHGDEITKQVKDRNDELKVKKEHIMNDIDKKEAIVERSNRDFSDIKDTLPEKQPTTYIHFMEDYTLAVLVISYLFMIISVIYLYVLKSYDISPKDSYKQWVFPLIQATIGSTFLSCFMYIILRYFS